MVGRKYERGEKALRNLLDPMGGYKAHGRRRKANALGKKWGEMMAGLAAVLGIWWDPAKGKSELLSIPFLMLRMTPGAFSH